jgi:hypothetical protein
MMLKNKEKEGSQKVEAESEEYEITTNGIYELDAEYLEYKQNSSNK